MSVNLHCYVASAKPARLFYLMVFGSDPNHSLSRRELLDSIDPLVSAGAFALVPYRFRSSLTVTDGSVSEVLLESWDVGARLEFR